MLLLLFFFVTCSIMIIIVDECISFIRLWFRFKNKKKKDNIKQDFTPCKSLKTAGIRKSLEYIYVYKEFQSKGGAPKVEEGPNSSCVHTFTLYSNTGKKREGEQKKCFWESAQSDAKRCSCELRQRRAKGLCPAFKRETFFFSLELGVTLPFLRIFFFSYNKLQ